MRKNVRLSQAQKRPITPQILPNQLTHRMQQTIQLLVNNNHKLQGRGVNQQRFCQLLDHFYTCYQQLGFITSANHNHVMMLIQPAIVLESMNKVVRTSQHLVRNVKQWIQSYQTRMAKKRAQERMNQQLNDRIQSMCSMCRGSIQYLKLKTATLQILGPSYARDMFQKQLLQQQQQKAQQAQKKKKDEQKVKEYNGSVSFLNKMIRDMQKNMSKYEAESIQVQAKEDHKCDMAMNMLEQMIQKVKMQFGSKIKEKTTQLLRKVQRDNQVAPKMLSISSHIQVKVNPTVKKQSVVKGTSQDHIIDKLREQNKHLHYQKYSLTALLTTSQNSQANLQVYSKQLARQLQKLKNSIPDHISTMNPKRAKALLNSPKVNIDSTSYFGSGQGEYKQKVNHRAGSKMLRTSVVSNIRGSRQMEGTSCIEESKQNQIHQIQEEEYNQNNIFTVNVACQWEQQNFQDSRRVEDRKIRKSKRQQNAIQDKASKTHSSGFKKLSKTAQKQAKNSLMTNKPPNQSSFNRNSTLQKPYNNLKKDNNIRQSKDSIDNANASKPQNKQKEGKQMQERRKSYIPILSKHHKLQGFKTEASQHQQLDIMEGCFQEAREHKDSGLKLQAIAQNLPSSDSLNVQARSSKHLISSSKKLQRLSMTLKNLTSKNHQTPSDLNNNLDQSLITNKQKHYSQLNKNTLAVPNDQNLSAKISNGVTLPFVNPSQNMSNIHPFHKSSKMLGKICKTQQEQPSKHKLNKNKNIFKPWHLVLFGGVSQSFQFQKKRNFAINQCLSQHQITFVAKLSSYLQSLKGLKTSFYENIVSFLIYPYQTIQKDQIHYIRASQQQIQKSLSRIVLLHSKKGKKIPSQQLLNFASMIGFSYSL